jgi:integrase
VLRTERKKKALRDGMSDMPQWVFLSENNTHMDQDNIRRRAFARCLERAGLRKVRIHDLRHSYASLLIEQGESLAYIRDQMGHHSIQVTVDIYGHLVPGANKEAVDKLDDFNDLPQQSATYTQPEVFQA